MELAELSADQRRRLVDATQAFEAWREADREFRHSYRGSMRWKTVNGKQYLYRVFGKIGQSLGPRSPELERTKADYTEQRMKLRRRLTSLEKRLKDMTRLNRASNLGRVPTTAARILRKLDAEGLLGKHLFVVGTNSLYAFEAGSGVLFETGLTATEDVDLLWDVRRHLSSGARRRAQGGRPRLAAPRRSFLQGAPEQLSRDKRRRLLCRSHPASDKDRNAANAIEARRRG